MKKIGVIANPEKKKVSIVTQELITWLKKRKKKVLLDSDIAKAIGRGDLACSKEELPAQVDLLIVLGGDGTLLSVARVIGMRRVPILGVNLGGLGFLAETTIKELYKTLEYIFAGKYQIEQRVMLNASIQRRGKIIEAHNALNDVVVSKGALSRILKLKVFIGDKYITTYMSDGLIISTPTGSTAYSLSAGGPVVSPDVEAIILTPICPHTLSNRPLIISKNNKLYIEIGFDSKEVSLTIDGQVGVQLYPGDKVLVKKAASRIKLITHYDTDYFQILRRKLKWGGHSTKV
ncbi:MAG: NAD(+)/NADH kinase [Candidatus Omnitrophica bacterium]|nr:NAD(+)/NADH kinase [Candidatus Omnitrophota bacterium]